MTLTTGALHLRLAQLLADDTARPPNRVYVRMADGTYGLITAIEVIGLVPDDEIVSRVTLAVGEGR